MNHVIHQPQEQAAMPTVTITLTDTPSGAVAIHSNLCPVVGAHCSPAQAAALDIISRTKRDYRRMATPLLAEVDIDAVHRSRDRVVENSFERPEAGLLSNLPHDA